ncbi:hypothetical protein AAF712_007194 [Marasmius tenuissimus]|uniref:JmjC domain-containing protein n=1 Tax=Marasmius tenuissimus TaxID=585030 RepID=A0ABR2ZX29_9AGAR
MDVDGDTIAQSVSNIVTDHGQQGHDLSETLSELSDLSMGDDAVSDLPGFNAHTKAEGKPSSEASTPSASRSVDGSTLDDAPVVANPDDMETIALRRSTCTRKPVVPFIPDKTTSSASNATCRIAKSSACKINTRSPNENLSIYQAQLRATLKRDDFVPTLERPRRGRRVFHLTSCGGQSYFWRAFLFCSKDHDRLNDLLATAYNKPLRTVPDNFAKFPADDSVLSSPLFPDPTSYGPPNPFPKKGIQVLSFVQYQSMSTNKIQHIFYSKSIIITGVPKMRANSAWDMATLAHLGSLDVPRQAHNKSIEIKMSPDEETIRTTFSVAFAEAQKVNSSKPLTFLDIQGYRDVMVPTNLDSVGFAYKQTLYSESLDNSKSMSSLWHIVATKDAHTPFHMDMQGAAAMIMVEVGMKLVFMLVPLSGDPSTSSNVCYSSRANLDMAGSSVGELAKAIGCEVQGILLTPGDVLLMQPGTYHFVFTLEPSICNGRHFYSLMNEDHTKSRAALVRLMAFLHQQFMDCKWVSDVNIGHAPDWSSMAGLLDFLTVANILELGPALWQQSYIDEEPKDNDLCELALARNWSRDLFDYYAAIHTPSVIQKSPHLFLRSNNGQPRTLWTDIRSSYLVQQMCCLIKHTEDGEVDMDVNAVMESHIPEQGKLGKDIWDRFEATRDGVSSPTLFPICDDHCLSYEWHYGRAIVGNPYVVSLTTQ